MKYLRIISIDDTDLILQSRISNSLKDLGEVQLARSLEEGYSHLRKKAFDVLLLDKYLGNQDSTKSVASLKSEFPYLAIVILTREPDFTEIERILLSGATHYLAKSDSVIEELRILIPEVYRNVRIDHALRKTHSSLQPLNGSSSFIQSVKSIIYSNKGSQKPILIAGEPGTGKNLIAKHIWAIEDDATRPFIHIDISAIPTNQMEKELFGSKGVGEDPCVGALLRAHGGDLLLEEITYLPLPLQAKLAVAIQTGTIRPIGSPTSLPVSVRIICTISKALDKCLKEKSFDEDLYSKINTILIQTMPLRLRKEDIVEIAEDFLLQDGKRKYRLTPDARHFLTEQAWPDNCLQLIRCLENAILSLKASQRAKIYAEDLIRFFKYDDHSAKKKGSPFSGLLPNSVKDINKDSYNNYLSYCEKYFLSNILNLLRWDVDLAADKLKLSRSSLYSKIKSLEIRK